MASTTNNTKNIKGLTLDIDRARKHAMKKLDSWDKQKDKQKVSLILPLPISNIIPYLPCFCLYTKCIHIKNSKQFFHLA